MSSGGFPLRRSSDGALCSSDGDIAASALGTAEERVGKTGVGGRVFHRGGRRVHDDYVLEDGVVLGQGFNGKVFQAHARHGTKKDRFAIKPLKTRGLPERQMAMLKTEVSIFLELDHPHIARLVGAYDGSGQITLVMELMEGGELFDRILEKKRYSENDAKVAVRQMLLALNYMHGKNVVHRDIKLENYMYEKKNGEHLKLIDFGFSKICTTRSTMHDVLGSVPYMAPEVFLSSYTSQCDMGSLGVTAHVLLLGKFPFSPKKGTSQLKSEILRGDWRKTGDKWNRISRVAQQFLEGLIVVDANARMTASHALNHAFLVDDAPGSCIDNSTAQALVSFSKATKFQRACRSMLAWSLTNEDRAKVRNQFNAIDTNRSGTITMGELKSVLANELNLHGDEEFGVIFDSLDTANTQEISYTEFLAAMVQTRIALHDDVLEATFRRFDADGTGYISVKNLRQALGEEFAESKVEELIAEADKDSDGRVSYTEFVAFLTNSTTETDMVATSALIDKQLRVVDASSTGSVSDSCSDSSSERDSSACICGRV